MNYDYVDSDNNLAERAMREVVKRRVMKSLLLTEEEPMTFAILLSIVMTYKKGDILELFKKIHGQEQEIRQATQDETPDYTPDAPIPPARPGDA